MTPPAPKSQSATIAVNPASPPRSLRLKLTSDPANLAPARKAVEGFAVDCGFDAMSSGEMGLCVNEALANITRHAYDGAVDQPVVLEADYHDEQLIVTLRDWGNGKQPPALPHHDPLTPGGLGLVCLKTLLDEVAYNPQPDGMLLRMMRRKRA